MKQLKKLPKKLQSRFNPLIEKLNCLDTTEGFNLLESKIFLIIELKYSIVSSVLIDFMSKKDYTYYIYSVNDSMCLKIYKNL